MSLLILLQMVSIPSKPWLVVVWTVAVALRDLPLFSHPDLVGLTDLLPFLDWPIKFQSMTILSFLSIYFCCFDASHNDRQISFTVCLFLKCNRLLGYDFDKESSSMTNATIWEEVSVFGLLQIIPVVFWDYFAAFWLAAFVFRQESQTHYWAPLWWCRRSPHLLLTVRHLLTVLLLMPLLPSHSELPLWYPSISE